jgi:hypothetical protein
VSLVLFPSAGCVARQCPYFLFRPQKNLFSAHIMRSGAIFAVQHLEKTVQGPYTDASGKITAFQLFGRSNACRLKLQIVWSAVKLTMTEIGVGSAAATSFKTQETLAVGGDGVLVASGVDRETSVKSARGSPESTLSSLPTSTAIIFPVHCKIVELFPVTFPPWLCATRGGDLPPLVWPWK